MYYRASDHARRAWSDMKDAVKASKPVSVDATVAEWLGGRKDRPVTRDALRAAIGGALT